MTERNDWREYDPGTLATAARPAGNALFNAALQRAVALADYAAQRLADVDAEWERSEEQWEDMRHNPALCTQWVNAHDRWQARIRRDRNAALKAAVTAHAAVLKAAGGQART